VALSLHLPSAAQTTNDAVMPLAGPRLSLREVRETDVNDDYHRWMNDPEVTRHLESRFFPLAQESLRDYVRKMRGDRDNLFLAIVLHEGERHIGNIKLGPINWIHRTGDIGLLLGEKSCWGKGYATEAIRCITTHAFDVLNLHKLTASCYHTNLGSARAFLKAGFVQEGVRRSQFYSDGVYVDQVLLGLVRPGTTGRVQ
jgi:RimJ/RimL family protein N-acetyltransferase